MFLMKYRFPIFSVLAIVASVTGLKAGSIESTYSTINLQNGMCPIIESSDEGSGWAHWRCPGYRGMPVDVGEGDLRMFVSFGYNGKNEHAFTQTFPWFNRIHTTLEWRLKDDGRGKQPFATILRWFLHNEARRKEDQILVVTTLQPGNTCQVGVVDATSNANANVLARQIADNIAPWFNCKTDKISWLGNVRPDLKHQVELSR